jgi:hypothetical protein
MLPADRLWGIMYKCLAIPKKVQKADADREIPHYSIYFLTH